MRNNGYVVEALVTEPFRVQIKAIIKTETLQEAVLALNAEYPKALITAAREIE